MRKPIKKLRVLIYVFGILLVIFAGLSATPFWRFLVGLRPVTPHAKLTFYQSQNCDLYLPYATPQDIRFSGDSLNHKTETLGKIVHRISVSGIGTIFYKNSNIKVAYDQVFVDGQALTHKPCSYILDQSGLRVGAIRADE